MSAQKTVPANATPLTPSQASSALNAAYRQVTGQAPTLAVLGLLLGQTALETANWQKIRNYNFGAIRASAGDRLVQIFGDLDVVDGVATPVRATFAAYESAAEGAAAYIRQLRARPHWWNGLLSGTAEGFVAGLTTPPAYFTANAAQYLSGLKSRAQAFLKEAEQAATRTLSPPPVVPTRQAPTWQPATPQPLAYAQSGGGGGALVGVLVVVAIGAAILKARRVR